MIRSSKLRTKGAFLLPLSIVLSLSLVNADELSQSSASPSANTTSAESTDSKVENMDKVKLNRSVITASGYEQDIKEASASISVIGKEELETKPYRDIAEAVADVPGVDIQRSKTGGFTISMRGFESKYTLILIDGKRQNPSDAFNKNGFDAVNTSFMPPLSMIERIEVIRGPASTLYGSDAIGGVINIITKKNPDKFSGSIALESTFQEDRLTYGNSQGVSGYLAIPLISKTLSLSVRGKTYSKESSRWVYPNGSVAGNTAGLFSQYNFGGRLNYTPNASNNIYLDGEFYHQGVMGSSLYGTTLTSANPQSIYQKTNAVLNHDGDYSFGKWNTYLQYGSTDNSSSTTALFSNSYIAKTQLVAPLDLGAFGFMKLSGGGEVWHESFKDGSTGNGVTDISYKTLYQTQSALFLEDEYTLTEWLTLTGGARYTYGSVFHSAFTPRIYAVFKLADFWTLKGGVSTGYKVPSIKETINGIYELNSLGANPRYGNPNLRPESSINYEIGTDFDFEAFNLNVTGFYTDFTDKIAYDTIQPGSMVGHGTYDDVLCDPISAPNRTRSCSVRVNLNKVYATGVETLFKIKPIYGISFDTSYTFTHSKQLTGANKGQPIQNQPKHLLIAKLNYNYKDFNAYLKSTSRLKTPVSPSSRQYLGDYYKDSTIVDLGLNYRFNKTLLLSFVVNNLFNQKIQYVYTGTGRNGDTYANAYQNIFDGRNYWVSLKYDF